MIILLLFFLSALSHLEADEKVLKSKLQFSTDLFKALGKLYPIDGVAITPSSVFHCLILIYISSSGSTEKALEKILHFDHSQKIHILENFFNDTKPARVGYELEFAERIYINKDVKVKPDMAKRLAKRIGVLKGSRNDVAVVNKWVKDNTKGLIQHILQENTVQPGQPILFVNAAYFKAEWLKPLVGGTSLGPFTLNDGSVIQKPFMKPFDGADQFVSYSDESIKAQIISLPYTGTEISMIVILPTTRPEKNYFPIMDVLDKLSYEKIKGINAALKQTAHCKTDLLMPKFKVEARYELQNTLDFLGSTTVFTEGLDLSDLLEAGMLKGPSPVVHQSMVRVNENGTEAASATVAVPTGISTCSRTVHIDAPFIFMIYNTKHDIMHFAGIVNNPDEH